MRDFRGEKYRVDSLLFASLTVSPTHSYFQPSYQARAAVISPTSTVIYLSGSFADEHDSSWGGINHSAGPNSVRKMPTRLIENKISSRVLVCLVYAQISRTFDMLLCTIILNMQVNSSVYSRRELMLNFLLMSRRRGANASSCLFSYSL